MAVVSAAPGRGSVSAVSAKPTPLRVGRVETRTVTVHGREVSYAEGGAGPLLLLIHGMAGTAENWSRWSSRLPCATR